MFFKCKVCQEKDLRIQELKSQIEYLRNFISPSNSGTSPDAIALEADGILSAQQHIIEISINNEFNEYEVEREADRIFSGTY